ncbi:hypothetical protein [Actinoallomurus acaciae]|uniref:Uncharacterized protein n=1 Tax=Actinoallomurus acaciae TaxID=502577 RepID=A0ABV5YJA8_9ACTN
MTRPADAAASSDGTPPRPSDPHESDAGASSRRLPSIDAIAIVVAAIFALLAALRLLPSIPWDDINIPTITW